VRLSAHSKAQHLPLGQALREYEGPANRDRLLSLLLPVQRAAESCAWLKTMVEAGEIFHPLRWTPVKPRSSCATARNWSRRASSSVCRQRGPLIARRAARDRQGGWRGSVRCWARMRCSILRWKLRSTAMR